MPDPRSDGADPAGAVSRGMRALLARRLAELAAGASPVGWKIGFNAPASSSTSACPAPSSAT